MRIHLLVLASFLALAGATHAAEAEPPRAHGAVAYTEKLKIGGGCDSLSVATQMSISMDVGGAWSAYFPATGLGFSGTMTPAGKPGVWNLFFDQASMFAYFDFLEALATDLCGASVALEEILVDGFELKLKIAGDTAAASVSLRSSGTGASAFGPARGTHRLKGKGTLAYDPGYTP
jgi:hypothetical protein